LTAGSTINGKKGGFDALKPEDFLNLMITQLQNQDPLEPASNEQLMSQFATIRDMELSVTLSNSIKSLTDQQRFGSSSALIGQYVIGPEPETGERRVEGAVRSVRFTDRGEPILELANGGSMPLKDLTEVVSLEELIGMGVQFVEIATDGRVVQQVGQIVGVNQVANGERVFEVQLFDENGNPSETLGIPNVGKVRPRDVVSVFGAFDTDASGATSSSV
jgi:flagellar basal-body rod modification protein FlgD